MKRGLLPLLLVVLILGGGVLWDYQRFLDAPIATHTEQTFRVPQGASLRAVGDRLAQRGLIERPLYWEILGRRSGQAGALRAGEYRLEPGMNPRDLLALFVSGRTLQYRLVIPEGWTFRQMMDAIAAHPHLKSTLQPEDYAGVMDRLGRPGEHPEGWFFPDTYLFPDGTTDLEFLRRAHRHMKMELESAWEDREEGLPLESPYEALILASIVQKEAGQSEHERVAAVFIERLRRGMRLQSDPTIIYGMEDFDGDIRRRDLRRDTPYNTYTRDGLPPTPIALPGAASLQAVTHPADSDALFFVGRGDGTHHFSRTYREHREAVIRFQLDGDASRYGP
ncbi:endolytic transglycosylase MltG [Ectothiorhodospira mobilis]|uniref:endolytic transglycosylase MltG n=1 Tax=Ectothiorhodospira mobilis TaxID=195064 RepID=UPI0019079EF4|nr:endolytic transglycosylase MltG [Ectothiorhodospira mobilis]MBK1690802.1 aminodeoxychorismate lyase [Ectothiorhodospira mobilis]